ncbi:MAG TPA: response regulator [Fibrobacteria bacterium]|nr:response regulator [Fibrobacteria bacterium]
METLIDGQTRLLEMVAFCEPLKDVLTACLRFCESHSDEMLTSVLLLDRDGKHLRHGAAPSLPPEFMRLVDGRAIGPRAGSCGTAAFLCEPVIVEDIATDPLWAEYRDFTLPFGLRACWSTPIFDSERRVLGTFAIYYRKPGLPKEEHLRLIRMVTHIAGIAILANRYERERREVFERISDAFVALDARWHYTYVNPQAGRMFGRAPESLIGKHIWTEFPEGVGQPFHLAYERAMREQRAIFLEEYHPSCGKWFEGRIYPSPDGLTIYFHDVTERKGTEERARQNEKMNAIGQLAGGVAHDFNNQLSIIQGYAGLLQNRIADPELKRFATAVFRAADRAGDLTRSLLAFSRQGHFETVPIDIHDLILEITDLLGHSIDRRIEIRKALHATRAVIAGDPSSLQNALLNLALNARDAMPSGGTLKFATEVADIPAPETSADLVPGACLRISVSDTGTGMTEAVKKRIFEPFFTTKPAGKGTGMGLASVFGTMKNHRGRISVDSAPGRGTTFHLYLPLAEHAAGRGIGSAPGSPRTRSLTLLIVDDEPPIQDMVADMLRSENHEILGASGGREALEIYRERWRDIDLILLDMVMSDMDGYQTFQELRRIHPAARVILSSGFSPEGKIQALLDQGAKGLLQKPYGKEQLEAAIAAALA